MAGASGKKLDETYKLAWLRGLKTTYYLRTVGSSHAEKSTVKAGHMNAVSSDGGAMSAAAPKAASVGASASKPSAAKTVDASLTVAHVDPATDMKFCAIDDPDCEACQ
jgi:ribonucleoside-diphosphate reductase alpha chain